MLHYRETEAFGAVVRDLSQEDMWAVIAYTIPALLQHVYNLGERIGLDNEQSVQSFCLDIMKKEFQEE
jgi:hypothetical protein